LTVQKEVIEIKEKIPVMTYSQYRRARKLVHQCCNYESGNCLALDDGEECVCVQSICFISVSDSLHTTGQKASSKGLKTYLFSLRTGKAPPKRG